MITKAEILMGREKQYPLTPELEKNLLELLIRINTIRAAWGKPMTVTSGYRPGHFNTLAKGAVRSKHMTCQAVDIADPKHELTNWIMQENRLENFNVWIEHPDDAPSWLHCQIVAPPSGLRVFRVKPAMPLS